MKRKKQEEIRKKTNAIKYTSKLSKHERFNKEVCYKRKSINKKQFVQVKKKKKQLSQQKQKSRAMRNEILSQHIMLKGTYFICNLYLYFLI